MIDKNYLQDSQRAVKLALQSGNAKQVWDLKMFALGCFYHLVTKKIENNV